MGGVDAGNPSHEVEVEERLDQREDRAVHVVDGGGEKEESADGPADVGLVRATCGGGGEAGRGQTGGLGRHDGCAPARGWSTLRITRTSRG